MIALFLLAANLVFFLGPATTIAIHLKDWQTLIAGSIASFTAIAAAIAAWRAVQRQISNQQRLASRAEDDAFLAIREGAEELYGMMNLIWRAVDVTLANRWPENREANYSLVVHALPNGLPAEKNVDALVEIAQQLGPTKRRKFLLFANMVRSLYRHIREYKDRRNDTGITPEEYERSRRFLVLTLRTYLTHAQKYLEAYDPESARIFSDRTKATVDHRNMHEHLEPMVERAERGENWMN